MGSEESACAFIDAENAHDVPRAIATFHHPRYEVPLVGIFEFEKDRLMCERVYFDMATLMRQLQG